MTRLRYKFRIRKTDRILNDLIYILRKIIRLFAINLKWYKKLFLCIIYIFFQYQYFSLFRLVLLPILICYLLLNTRYTISNLNFPSTIINK